MPDGTDKKYAVVTTATAKAAIREQVRFIAVEQQKKSGKIRDSHLFPFLRYLLY